MGKIIIACLLPALLAAIILDMVREPRLIHAIGVVSACGMYAVAAVRDDGSVVVYDAENEATEAEAAIILELEQEKRYSIVVPCPMGANLGDEEKESHNASYRRGHDAR